MTDVGPATQEVAKARRGLLVGLLGLVLVVAAIAGVMYVTGIDPLALLWPVPADEPAVAEPADETTITPVASPATVPLPPADAQEAMYWEQVASEETIAQLVNNEFSVFELSQVATSADRADIRVTATYRDGSVMSGWLVLRQYEGAWYFAMITADGHETATPDTGEADAAVVKAIVEQQAANQDVFRAILDGTYDTINVTRITRGSGTAMADVELSKSGDRTVKGRISFINADNGAGSQWFITAFAW